MLKFTIVDSPQQFLKTKFIESIRERVMCSQGVNIAPKSKREQAYIIVETKNKHIVGIAYLLKKTRDELSDELKEILGGYPDKKDLWECPAIYLDISMCSLALGITPLGGILSTFYQDIYGKLVEFGEAQGISFIIIKLLPEIYELTKTIGGWPYVAGLNPHHSSDGLFHGILPLSGSRYDAYCLTREDV